MKEQAKKFPRKKITEQECDPVKITEKNLRVLIEKELRRQTGNILEGAFDIGAEARDLGFEVVEEAIEAAIKSRGFSVLGRVAGMSFGALMGILWPADAQAHSISGLVAKRLGELFPESKDDLIEKIILHNAIRNAKRRLMGLDPDRLPYSMPVRGIVHRLASTDLKKLRDQAAEAAEAVEKAIVRTRKFQKDRAAQTQSEAKEADYIVSIVEDEIRKLFID
jgi:hypothetical protein